MFSLVSRLQGRCEESFIVEFHSLKDPENNLLNHPGYTDTSEEFTLTGSTVEGHLQQYARYWREWIDSFGR